MNRSDMRFRAALALLVEQIRVNHDNDRLLDDAALALMIDGAIKTADALMLAHAERELPGG